MVSLRGGGGGGGGGTGLAVVRLGSTGFATFVLGGTLGRCGLGYPACDCLSTEVSCAAAAAASLLRDDVDICDDLK